MVSMSAMSIAPLHREQVSAEFGFFVRQCGPIAMWAEQARGHQKLGELCRIRVGSATAGGIRPLGRNNPQCSSVRSRLNPLGWTNQVCGIKKIYLCSGPQPGFHLAANCGSAESFLCMKIAAAILAN